MYKKLCALLTAWLVTALPVVAQQNGSHVGFDPAPTNPAPTGANYVVISAYDPLLTNERLLSPTARFIVTDNGANGTLVLELATVGTGYGGTGATTAQGGFNNLADGTAGAAAASGDIVYRGAANWTRLPKGSDGAYLSLASGIPSWVTPPTGAPTSASYLTLANDATLSAERVLTQGSGLAFTDAGVNSTLTLAVDSTVVRTTGAQSIAGPKTLSAMQTNGLILGGAGANTITLKITDPTSSRIHTIPDLADAFFAMTEGAQTINGVKTFGSAPKLSTNTLTSSTGNTITFPNAVDTVTMNTQAQVLINKELTAPSLTSGSTLVLKQTTANYTIDWANPGGARAYHVTDVSNPADFVMKTAGAAYTAGKIPYADGSKLDFTAVGSVGQPLLSQAGATPTWGTLGLTGGGTGGTTQQTAMNNTHPSGTTGDIVYFDGTNWTRLARGSNGSVLQSTAGSIAWGAASGTVTSFSAGTLSPLFTTSVATATTTPALTFALSNAAAYTVLGNNTSSTAAPAYQSLVSQQLPSGVSFGASGTAGVRPILGGPSVVTVTAQGTPATYTYAYLVVAKEGTDTSATAQVEEQSGTSASTQITNGAFVLGATNFNRITWTATPNAGRYVVYRVAATAGGAAGSALGLGRIAVLPSGTTTFDDTGVSANTGDTATASASSFLSLNGQHISVGNWTNNYTTTYCYHCLLSVDGTVTINSNVSVQTELTGGTACGANTLSMGGHGSGLGAGNGASLGAAATAGGGGGGFGGTGGAGGYSSASFDRGARGGNAYDVELQLCGSSGGAGASNASTASGAGGAGGGGFALSATGAIVINGDITANGADGGAAPATSTAGGGGGSGGGIDIRSLSTVTINAGKTLSVVGGAGGAGATSGAAGGGGAGGFIRVHGTTVTNNGTVNVSGGAAGGGTSATAASAGSTGLSRMFNFVLSPRMGY